MNEQGTDAWKAERLGKVTASRVADVIARTKSGYGASRANYMAQLIAERLTGVPGDSYTNAAMQWGIDTEADARAAYEFYTGETVAAVGFIPHPEIGLSGASPDGLVGTDGLVEIKCPLTATHIDTLLDAAVPGKYVTQMLWQMACTGRQWCDFVSFDPRMPEEMRLFVKRVQRDDKRLAEIVAEIRLFLDELADKTTALRERYAVAVAKDRALEPALFP